MHPLSFTGSVLAAIARDRELSSLSRVICAPQRSLGVLSPFALRQSIEASWKDPKVSSGEVAPTALIIWAFSAGCVGAVVLANHWQRYRGPVLALFMVDGWGVPRPPAIPVHRLSHDQITHDTSRWLGSGDDDWYADPAVPHLTLWQQPQAAAGRTVASVASTQAGQRLTAAEFLCGRSRAYIDQYRSLSGG